jgi:hypothetical protein
VRLVKDKDQDVLDRINALAAEEHELFGKEAKGEATHPERERLKEIEDQLDQCWDLLHQRRARRAAGLDVSGIDDFKVREGEGAEDSVG